VKHILGEQMIMDNAEQEYHHSIV